jgi:hypothetical protein
MTVDKPHMTDINRALTDKAMSYSRQHEDRKQDATVIQVATGRYVRTNRTGTNA